ncbi:MAG: sigma-70 family RNA polymerase sigma factor [Acidobacteria bacterium]|nr:sigma-70 family RNA polymerase sigma factor [Acidobacteriota bacterium]
MNHSPTPKKEWILTQGAFDKLLVCLDPDRERAGEVYETVRRKLMKFFECRGCLFPEDYTDETIDRVVRKIDEGEELHKPSSYFYSVARMVFMESLREQEKERAALEHQPPRPAPADPDESDRLQCLNRCIQSLSPESHELVIRYYQGEKGVKIENRQRLAERLKIPVNALRIRACRLRKGLEVCVDHCLKQSAG